MYFDCIQLWTENREATATTITNTRQQQRALSDWIHSGNLNVLEAKRPEGSLEMLWIIPDSIPDIPKMKSGPNS